MVPEGDANFSAYIAREREYAGRHRSMQFRAVSYFVPLVAGGFGWSLPWLQKQPSLAVVWMAALGLVLFLFGIRVWVRSLIASQNPSKLSVAFGRPHALMVTRFLRAFGPSSSVFWRSLPDAAAEAGLAACFLYLQTSSSGLLRAFLWLGLANFALASIQAMLSSRVSARLAGRTVGRNCAGLFIVREELTAEQVANDAELMELVDLSESEDLPNLVPKLRRNLFTQTRLLASAMKILGLAIAFFVVILVVFGMQEGILAGLGSLDALRAGAFLLSAMGTLACLDTIVRASVDRSPTLLAQLDSMLSQGNVSVDMARRAFFAIEVLRLNGHAFYPHLANLLERVNLGKDAASPSRGPPARP